MKEKEQAHSEGDFQRSVHIWIINNKKEILLQRRSSNKKNYPNKWDISSAGHIRSRESIIEGAKREVKEELGINIDEKDLEFIGINKSDKPYNKEFQYIYLYRTDKVESDYTFNDGEVAYVKYFKYDDFEKMVKNKSDDFHYTTAEEYEMLCKYVEKIFNKSIVSRKRKYGKRQTLYSCS